MLLISARLVVKGAADAPDPEFWKQIGGTASFSKTRSLVSIRALLMGVC
jgi:hypothetical protein